MRLTSNNPSARASRTLRVFRQVAFAVLGLAAVFAKADPRVTLADNIVIGVVDGWSETFDTDPGLSKRLKTVEAPDDWRRPFTIRIDPHVDGDALVLNLTVRVDRQTGATGPGGIYRPPWIIAQNRPAKKD